MSDVSGHDQLLTRWGQLKTERATWVSHWKEISDNLMPRSGRYFVQDRNKGTRRHNSIYDSTATRAHRVLSAGMMATLTNPSQPWLKLQTQDLDLNKYKPVELWLNEVTNIMFSIFSRSNTYRSLHSIYDELGGFGTGAAILVPDFEKVIHHYPLTIGEYCIATNWQGEVVTLYREFQKTVAELVREFGYNRCSLTVRNLYDRGSLGSWITIIHAIEPRADRDPAKLDAKNMPWKSCYFELGSKPGGYLRESGFKRFPGVCPRWAISGGDIYGNSPGMEALGDIKQLQHEQLRKAQGIDKLINPPLQMPSSMKNRDVETLPGGQNWVDSMNPSGAIHTLYDVRIDLSHLLGDIQDVRQRINSTFFVDLFLMLANGVNDNMTATEVAERHEEKLLMLGPIVDRIKNEMLDPLVNFTFDQIMEAGIAPPPPPELQGHVINIELIGILAQAQRAIGTKSIDRFVGNLGAVAQFKPEVLDNFDVDKWAQVYSGALGIDPQLILPKDQVDAMRQERAQAQQAAQKAALMNQGADTAQKLANAKTTDPSALTALAESQTQTG